MTSNYKPILIASLVVILTIVSMALGYYKVRDLIFDQELSNIASQAHTTATELSTKIANSKALLRGISRDHQILESTFAPEQKVEVLRTYARGSGHLRVGVSDLKGNTINSDGLEYFIGNQDWFKQTLLGESMLVHDIRDPFGLGEKTIIVTEPLYLSGEIIGITFASQNNVSYIQQAEQTITHSSDRVYIVDQKYKFFNTLQDDFKTAVAQNIQDSGNSITSIKALIDSASSGTITLEFGDESYLTAVESIENSGGWAIIAATPASHLTDTSVRASLNFIIAGTIATIALGATTYYASSQSEHMKQVTERYRRFEKYDYGIESVSGLRTKSNLSALIRESYKDLHHNEMAFIGLIKVDTFSQLEKSGSIDFADLVRSIFANRLAELEDKNMLVGFHSHDKYLIYSRGFSTRRDAQNFALALKSRIEEPLKYSDLVIDLNVKLGIRLFFIGEKNASDVDYLIECSEFALQNAINRKKSNIGSKALVRQVSDKDTGMYVFDTSTQEEIQKKRSIWKDISHATAQGELRLLYQPVFDLETKEIHSVEVLLRWLHPEWGILVPAEFMEAAVQQGYIVDMGKWAIDTALDETQILEKMGIPVSINIAPAELLNPGFLDHMCSFIIDRNVGLGHIILECPLEALMSENEQMLNSITRLEACGIEIFVDDFYACAQNMDYLKSLSVKALKLSVMSTAEIAFNKDKRRNLQMLVEVCDEYDIALIAKSVKSESLTERLKELGCKLGQGQHFARPLSAEELKATLAGDTEEEADA